ncbi:hypothetical protein AAFF_G00090880 [Aldrovandia affinis]|uniref:Uncharacterized protein n=1 Tax=Aldrovandia affinis TaxID=143900 RepID=A0AAD7WBS4_9TELE|nr:hypothetical protein AAFF_G00090880 [Aldrovandia affinis]
MGLVLLLSPSVDSRQGGAPDSPEHCAVLRPEPLRDRGNRPLNPPGPYLGTAICEGAITFMPCTSPSAKGSEPGPVWGVDALILMTPGRAHFLSPGPECREGPTHR